MIPKKMKAAVIHGFGQPLHIEEMPVREPNTLKISQLLKKRVNKFDVPPKSMF